MMSGDAPRCINEVSRKKRVFFFLSLKLLCNISETPPIWRFVKRLQKVSNEMNTVFLMDDFLDLASFF